VPITFSCECGKTLRVKDELAGKRVRCPNCQEILAVPDDAEAGIQSPAAARNRPAAPPPPPRRREPEDDDPLPLPGSRARLQNDDADMRRRYDPEEDEDDRPRRRRRAEEDEDPPEDRPRSRRRPAEEDEDPPEDRPRRKRKRRSSSSESSWGGPNWGVVGIGALMMIGSVVWFVLGLMADIIFFYPPILFILGIIALARGLVGQEN
jgi:hypothetical protein